MSMSGDPGSGVSHRGNGPGVSADSQDARACADASATPAAHPPDVPRRRWPLELTVPFVVLAVVLWECLLYVLAWEQWQPDWSVIALFASTMSHSGLTLLWAVLGRSRPLLRWAGSGLVWIVTATAFSVLSNAPQGFDPKEILIFTILFGSELLIMGSPLAVLRWRGWRWTADHASGAAGEPLQFSLAQLFGLVTLAAVCFGVARLIDFSKAEIPTLTVILVLLEFGVCNALAVLTAVGCALSSRGAAWRLVTLVVVPTILGMGMRQLMMLTQRGSGSGDWLVAIPIITAWQTAIVLLIFRKAGMRLVRITSQSSMKPESDK